MQILSPDEIKKDKVESAEQGLKRSTALAAEETRISRELNLMRSASEDEKARIKAEMEAYKEEITQYRETLKLEVESLESRRRASFVPIKETKKEVDELLKKTKDTLEEINAQKEDIRACREENLEFAEELRDKECDLNDRNDRIKLKERRIIDEENRLKESAKLLAQKWVDLHTATETANREISQREQKTIMREKTFETRQIEQDARECKLNEKERAVADKYATLIRTQERLK